MICTVIESHPAPESTRPPGFFCVNPLSHALRLDVINLPLSGEVASRSDDGEDQPLCTLYKNGEKTLAALRECP